VGSKLNAKIVGAANNFISHVHISDLLLGEHSPTLIGIRLSKEVTDDLAVSGDADLVITYLLRCTKEEQV
jgi:Ca2+-dependent lipid-binding protein